ncbi:MAG: FAD-dependent oxidoreductase, partial [Salinisphaera sp.]|nr:FAD-dependent oxidoreductase [Salinisphaera sp.]
MRPGVAAIAAERTLLTRRRFLQGLGVGGALTGLGAAPRLRAADGHVVIAGGGFGGATCARYLCKLAPGLRVSLVDRQAAFVTGPFCNTVIAGLNPVAAIRRDHQALAASGIEFIQSEIAAIDPVARRLTLAGGRQLAGDVLVVAPGIALCWEAIAGYSPEVAETIPHAWPGGADQLTTLRAQLRAMR